ncbi:hypothetical protein RRG08_065782 [Elysia crispata]|uniref:Uncharacterized protein n=1 Tax=Elysia crispata TaxID=231223 RepID=A0AAE1DKS6_9GAST|nr:hypothetical protein RRG08_065782 [Elysia crispata]
MTSLFLFAAEVRHCLCMIFLTTYNIQQRQAVQSDHRRSEAGGRPKVKEPLTGTRKMRKVSCNIIRSFLQDAQWVYDKLHDCFDREKIGSCRSGMLMAPGLFSFSSYCYPQVRGLTQFVSIKYTNKDRLSNLTVEDLRQVGDLWEEIKASSHKIY